MSPNQGPVAAQKALRSAVAQVTKVTSQLQMLKREQEVLTQRLTSIESEKDLLENDRDQRHEEAARLRAELMETRERVKLAEQKLERERDRLAKASESLKSDRAKLVSWEAGVRTMVEHLQSKNRALAEEATLREARVRVLEAERDGWRQRVTEIETSIPKLTSQLEKVTLAKSAEENCARDTREKLKACEQELKSARLELDRAHQVVTSAQSARRALEAELAGSQHALSKSVDDVARLTSDLEHMKSLVESLKKQREDWLRKEDALTAKIADASAQIASDRRRNEEELCRVRANFEDSIHQLGAELDKAKKASLEHDEVKSSLWRDVLKAERSRDEASRRADHLQMELESQRAQVAKLATGNEGLREELSRVQEEAGRALASKDDELLVARNHMTEMERAHRRLEAAAAIAESDFERSRDEAAGMAVELSRVREQCEEIRKQESAAQAEVAKLRVTVEHQKEHISRSDAAHQSDKSTIERLSGKVQELEDLKFRLNEKLQASEIARDTAQREVLGLQHDLSAAREAEREAQESSDALKAELIRTQQDRQRTQLEVQKAQEEIARLQVEISKSSDLERRLTEDKQSLIRRADQAYDEVNSLKLAMANAREGFQRELVASTGALRQQVSELESARQALEQIEASHKDDIAGLRAQVAASLESIIVSQRSEAALREELDDARRALGEGRLQLELSRKDAQKWEELFERTRPEKDAHVKKCELLSVEVNSLREKLAQSEERLRSVDSERLSLSARSDELKQECARSASEAASSKDALNHEIQLKTLLVSENRRLKEELAVQTDNVSRAEVAKKGLWEELVAMERAKGELCQNGERLKGEISALNVTIENLRSERASLQVAVRDCERRIAELLGKIENANDARRELEVELASRIRDVQEQVAASELFRHELNLAREAIKSNESAIAALKEELSRAIQARDQGAVVQAEMLQRLLAAQNEKRILIKERDLIASSAIDFELQVERLTQSLEQSERARQDLESSHDALSKVGLERQLEFDRLKRELERVSENLEVERARTVRKRAANVTHQPYGSA